MRRGEIIRPAAALLLIAEAGVKACLAYALALVEVTLDLTDGPMPVSLSARRLSCVGGPSMTISAGTDA